MITIVCIATGAYWPWFLSPFWLIPIGLLLLFSLVVSSRFSSARWVNYVLIAFLILVFQMSQFKGAVDALWQSGRYITIKGQIVEIFQSTKSGGRIEVKVDSIENNPILWLFVPNVRLFIQNSNFLDVTKNFNRSNISPKLGEQWQFQVRLSHVIGQLNQAGMDSEKYYVAQGLHGKGRIIAESDQNKRLSISHSIRQKLYQQVSDQISHLDSARFILALSFGDRSLLTEQDWQNLRGSGLAHLMAISGLHIGFAFAIGWAFGLLLMRVIGVRFHSITLQWLPTLTALALGFSYAYLAGFSLPTQRAFIFGIIFFSLKLFGRHCSLWQVLLYSTFLVLILQPFALLQMSFWFSFGAVIIIYFSLWFVPSMVSSVNSVNSDHFLLEDQNDNEKVKMLRRMGLQWWGLTKTSLVIQCGLTIGMAGFSIMYWQGLSVISLIVNLIVIPWVGFISVPLIFSCLILTFVGFSIPNLWALLDASLQPVMWILNRSEAFWISIPTHYALWFFIAGVGILLSRFIKWHSCLIIVLLMGIISSFNFLPKPNWQVKVLDVGQGLSVLIGRDQEWVLYDTGIAWNRGNEAGSMAQSVIDPVLNHFNVNQLEGMIISHADLDHAGGRDWIEENYTPNWMRSSDIKPNYLPCIAGQKWQWNQLTFNVLWPPKQVIRSYNPHSCVVQVSDGNFKILLTGDVDEISERLLLRGTHSHLLNPENSIESDILLVPHHGSKTSSHLNFIQQVAPKVAIASASKTNQWGLPADIIKQRYINQGIDWLDTANSGQITVNFFDDHIDIKTMRSTQYSAWYRKILRNTVE